MWPIRTWGNTRVEISDDDECYTASDKVMIPLTQAGTGDLSSENRLFLFPNPARNTVHILYTGSCRGEVRIRIISAGGSVVKELKIVKNNEDLSAELDLAGFDSGIYILN